MRKIVLTSAGFDNPIIGKRVKELLSNSISDAKVLFVVSAAVTDSQKRILPLCKNEIMNLGIKENQIKTYDFDYQMMSDEVIKYDMIYVAGGSTKALLDKMGKWKNILETFFDNGGLYVGVSAGSIAFCDNYKNGLSYVNANLKVHQPIGTLDGDLSTRQVTEIALTDRQAILVLDNRLEIIS